MKIFAAVIFIVLLTTLNFAQDISVEKKFEKNKPKLRLEKFSMGEDATSGFDYLIYMSKSKIVKIRSIWNGGASSKPQVEDYYFKDGKLILFASLPAEKRQFKNLVAGRNVALVAQEKLYLKDDKLVTWLEKGKPIPNTDTRWKNKEKEVLERAESQLENYKDLKTEANQ